MDLDKASRCLFLIKGDDAGEIRLKPPVRYARCPQKCFQLSGGMSRKHKNNCTCGGKLNGNFFQMEVSVEDTFHLLLDISFTRTEFLIV